MSELRLGVVGLGGAGRQHLAASVLCPQVRVAAVFDPDPTAVSAALNHLDDVNDQAGAEAAPQPPVQAASLEALLADDVIDAVSLCVPPGQQERLAVQSLRAGKAVLLEKPPALTEQSLDTVLETARRENLPATVMLQHRFRLPAPVFDAPAAEAAVAVLEVSRYRRPGHFDSSWRSDVTQSGGGMFAHLAIHFVDIACQLLGEPTKLDVFAVSDLTDRVDASFCATATFASGSALAMTGTTASPSFAERLAVYGRTRTVVVGPGSCTVDSDGKRHEQVTPAVPVLRSLVLAELREAVLNGTAPPRSGLERARGAVRLMEQMRTRR